MKYLRPHTLGALLSLVGGPAAAQDMMLACFNSTLDTAAKILACDDAISQGNLPNDTLALAYASRGDARSQSGNAIGALSDYDTALRMMPDDYAARIGRAQVLENLNRPKDAEADYSIVIERAPRTQEVLLGDAYTRRGALRLEIGDTAAGIADLGEARRFDPRNPKPFKTRGAYFLRNGEAEQAALELEQAVDLNAGDSEAQILLGSAQLQLGQSEAAVRAFTSALIVETDNVVALRGRATAYGQLQNYGAAITDYTAALNISGEDTASLEGRGAALLRVGAFAGATSDFDKLLEMNPNDDSARFFRANARFQSGDPTGAAADFSVILNRRPSDGDARVGRGIALQFTGDYKGAEADFTTVLESVPDAAQALANRGFTRIMKGDFAAAAEDLTAAMDLPNAPPYLALWRYIAEARAEKPTTEILTFALERIDPGRWPAAIIRYFLGDASGDEIIAAAIDNPTGATGRLCEAYFFLGQAALILGDKTEAQRLFNAALNTAAVRYTEYAGAKAELARLKAFGD